MGKEDSIIILDNETEKQSGNVIAKLPKEQMKSLFYLFAGKPDSQIKVFQDPIHITPSDIVELNQNITEKLATHHIDTQVTTVQVGYKNAHIQEFGTWIEFESYRWNDSEAVEEVVIKWDFMVDIKQYQIPQRHTLLVRISSDIKPSKFLQLLSSGNSEDFEQMEMLTSPAFCRVDFINAQISKELINQVSDWYKTRKSPKLIPNIYYWLKKKRQRIAEIIHHSFSLIFALLWISLFLWLITNKYNGHISIEIASIWIFLGLYLMTPIHKIGHILASQLYEKLENIEGNKVVFEFTSGDKKKIADMQNNNSEEGKKFFIETVKTLVIEIILLGIGAFFFKNS